MGKFNKIYVGVYTPMSPAEYLLKTTKEGAMKKKVYKPLKGQIDIEVALKEKNDEKSKV